MYGMGLRCMLTVGAALLITGCGSVVSSALSGASGGFKETVGQAVGEGVGRAVGGRIAAGMTSRMPMSGMTADMASLYIGHLFSIAFHSGSYSVEQTPYAPGEWTRWRVAEMTDDGSSAEFERAFLGKADGDNEWWRVKYITTEGSDTSAMVLEGLFSADKSQILRLRALMPGNTEPGEMPVREGTYGYVQPVPLTAESIRGATVGTERVTVPAGTFNTRHVRYGSIEGESLDWWLSDQVPGDLVRYTARSAGESETMTVELIGHGKGARSELGITL